MKTGKKQTLEVYSILKILKMKPTEPNRIKTIDHLLMSQLQPVHKHKKKR